MKVALLYFDSVLPENISSNDILASRLLESKVPSSSSSVSWNVPSCSCVTRTTFSKVVSKTFVEELKPFTVPVWVVNVFAFAKVPLTSLRTKWALSDKSGGLLDLKSKPWSSILIDFIEPISSVTARSFAPVPVVVDIETVGSDVYPTPPPEMWALCIEPDSELTPRFSKVSNSKTILSFVSPSITVVWVSCCSKFKQFSVTIWWQAFVDDESVPS